jgi:diguanylate cyclase (GGDEF)-like protein
MLKKLGILIILLGTALTAFAFQAPLGKQNLDNFESIHFLSHAENLSLEEVKNIAPLQWETSHTKNINFGFSQDHYWFKLTLKNLTPSDAPFYLRSKYPLLDTLDLYLFSGSTLVQEFHTGDAIPFKPRPIRHPSFIFPLNITTDNQYTVYMHAHTAGSLQLSLSLQNEGDFWQALWQENTIRAIFYAVLLSMIFYNAFIFLILLERAYLYYVLYLTTFTLLMANMHGWAFQLFWPNTPKINEVALTFLVGLLIFTSALFTSSFLRLKEIKPSSNRIVMIFAKLGIISSVIALFIPYSSMAQASTILTAVIATIGILLTLHAVIYNRRREAVIFVMSWISILAGFVLYAGQKFGVLPINALTEYGIEFGGGSVALLLSLGLADRINSERKTRIEAQKRLFEIQRLANERLDKKVKERTAELKTINNQLQAASITDSLTQIKNRHYFDYKLTAEYRRAYREKSEISLLMLDIDHFKKFNDNYGHQAGDEVLRRVAAAIQNIVNRPGDTAFRYGGEEFSVLLPSTPKEGAYIIAESIRKHVKAMPFQWQGKSLSVTISIGIASCIPSYSKGESELLKQADNALYLAKEHGRDRVSY